MIPWTAGSFLFAVAASLLLTPLVVRQLKASRVIDVPNRRSSHRTPVPRGGGIGILCPLLAGVAGLFLAGQLSDPGYLAALTIGTLVLGAVGFLDDVYSLPATWRLLIQIFLAAVCLRLSGLYLNELTTPGLGVWMTGPLAPVLAAIFVVGFANMYNFMDGINGLAGCQALIGAGGLAVLGVMQGDPVLAYPMALLAGGAVGFLKDNFPAGKVFMGDVGSLPIGFLLAMGVLRAAGGATGADGLPFWLPMMFIWPFLFDATYTLVNRAVRGRNPFRAHRSHLYQRLLIAGWTHVRVTLIHADAMLLCAAGVFVCLNRGLDSTGTLLFFWGAASLSLIWALIIASRIRATRTES